MDQNEEAEVQHRTKNGGVAVQPVSDVYLNTSDHNGHRNVSHAYAGNINDGTEHTRVRVRAFHFDIWMALG